ncbi:MAG TPA: sulfite exporter TauE/SafE family protein [Arthrobacter sp.]|nr:sulfite exporter TauE/SafE family protein [Arthrobacter sp.]
MTGAEFALIAVAIFVGACLQASSGFGLGMLAAPVIAMVEPALLPATLILLALLVTVLVTVRERQHLDLRGTGWALLGRIPGSLLGTWLVALLSREGLAWVVVAVVLAGLLLAAKGWAPRPGRANLIIAGAASGIMGTATSIGGPPMALVWQGHDGPRMRGTMSAFFMVGSTISMVMLWLSGAVTAEMLVLALWMVPAVAGGFAVSRVVNRFLNPKRLKALAIGASVLGSVLLAAQLISQLTTAG